MEQIKKWIDAHASIGVLELPPEQRSGRYAFNLMSLMGALTTPPWMVGYALIDPIGMAPLWLAISPICLFAFIPYIARRSTIAAHLFGGLTVIVCFGYATYLTGRDSGLYLFILNGLMIVVIHQSAIHPRRTALFAMICSVAMVYCYLAFPEPSGDLPVGERFNNWVFVLALVTIFSQVTQVLFALNNKVFEAENALAAEHARSEALLQNLLPVEIAKRLKELPGNIIADDLPDVTLLFADIVDFTPRSARMRPEDLVGWLNRIFSAFDRLAAERGLEKIKTIGDAYMVAAGLPTARPDHAEIMADMALAMRQEVELLSEELGEQIDLRIGIHSGPAIAGVIGTAKVFYDVWGETVNTASRMESHGEPGRIQVTDTTQALLSEDFIFEKRGTVEIKGIGPIETWCFWWEGSICA